jgi:H+/Cl- antiporter ClcA
MTKTSRGWLGILTFLPIVLLFAYMFSVAFIVVDAIRYGDENLRQLPWLSNVFWMVIIALALGLLSFGLLIYYVIHAINNKKIDSNEKVIWVLVFVVGTIVAFPIYYFMRIVREPEHLSMSAT